MGVGMAFAKIPVIDRSRRTGANKPVPIWQEQTPRTTGRQNRMFDEAMRQNVALEADPFNICILNYTMTCPLACDYCCYTCGPKRTETMDFNFAMGVVDQAIKLGVFSEFGFTGGEPLVYFDDILKLTARMKKANMPFSMISACDWACDDQATQSKLQPLLDNGMSVFTISHDPSHERWVPREHAVRAGAYVLNAGCRLVVCGSFFDDEHDLQKIFPEFANHPEVSFVTRVVLPTPGRAEGRKITPSFYPRADLSGPCTCYKRVYHDVTVFWDGEVYPCCSVYNRDTPGLSFGNLYQSPLSEVWDAIESSAFIRKIKWSGFDRLEKDLIAWRPGLASELDGIQGSIGPCDRCHLFLSNSTLREAVMEWSQEQEVEQVKSILKVIAQSDPEGVKKLASILVPNG